MLLDINEVTTRLGVTPRFVRRLGVERRIPFHKVGRYVRFDPDGIAEYLCRCRVEVAPEWRRETTRTAPDQPTRPLSRRDISRPSTH
ncbi:MAG: helix-turn-helix domain-containing protein [Actinomycetia bacterium]|nr:helix-turn-helix domain-containing protein [Actinomycetes bacterium]